MRLGMHLFSVFLFSISGVVLTMKIYLFSPETPNPDLCPTLLSLDFLGIFLSLFRIL
jgi:hypothetical protein